MPTPRQNLTLTEIWDLEDRFSAVAGKATGRTVVALAKPEEAAPVKVNPDPKGAVTKQKLSTAGKVVITLSRATLVKPEWVGQTVVLKLGAQLKVILVTKGMVGRRLGQVAGRRVSNFHPQGRRAAAKFRNAKKARRQKVKD